MLNELFRTYKKIILIVLIMVSAVIFWFFGCHRSSHGEEQILEWKQNVYDGGGYNYSFKTQDLEGKVTFGIKGYMVKNKNIPVHVTISASGSDFSGLVKIAIPGSFSGGVAYQSGLQCEKGEESSVDLIVPQLGNASYFTFEILDQYENLLISRTEIPTYSEWSDGDSDADGQICLGVLCDSYENISYLDGQILDTEEGKLKMRTISLDRSSFPNDLDDMDMLSGILLDNYSIKALSKKQREVLYSWIKEGGNLIIASGEHGRRVLNDTLSEKFMVESGDIDTERLRFNHAENFSGEISLYLNQLCFQENAGWKRVRWSEPASFYEKSFGKGSVEIVSFSFTDDALQQWNQLDTMTTALFGRLLRDVFDNNMDRESSIWNMEMALSNLNTSQMPNAFYYGLFFLIYICCITLVAYFMLRRIKRAEYIWIVVPVIAIFFTACILLRSRGVSSTVQNALSAIRITDDENDKNDLYFLYQNAEGESRNIELISAIDGVDPLDYEYYQDTVESTANRTIQEDYTISHTRHGYHIDFMETTPGTMRMLNMKENKSRNYGEKSKTFSADIQGDYTSFSGSITNSSDKDFDKVLVVRGNEFWIGQNMKSQETVNIKAGDVRCYPQLNLEGEIFTEESDGIVASYILNYLEYRYLKDNSDLSNLIVIGITLKDNYQLLSNGERLGNQIGVYANHFSVTMSELGEYQVNINLESLADDLSYSELQTQISEKDKLQVEYQFDSNRTVWVMARCQDNYTGKIYAYNYKEERTEEILASQGDVMEQEALQSYISEKNEMRLTYQQGEDEGDDPIPVLSVWLRKQARKD